MRSNFSRCLQLGLAGLTLTEDHGSDCWFKNIKFRSL